MKTTVPPIDKLSRAELLILVSGLGSTITDVVIAAARAVAATQDWERLAKVSRTKRRQYVTAYRAFEKSPESLSARRRKEEAGIAAARADLAAARCWTRRTRLVEQFEALRMIKEAA